MQFSHRELSAPRAMFLPRWSAETQEAVFGRNHKGWNHLQKLFFQPLPVSYQLFLGPSGYFGKRPCLVRSLGVFRKGNRL